MALLWIEGFEGFGSGPTVSPAGIVTRKYARVDYESFLRMETGRFGGHCLYISTNQYGLGTGSLTTNSTVVLGLAVKFTNVPTGSNFLNLYDGATLGVNVRIVSGGELEVRCGTTQLGITTGLGIVAGVWYYIELKVTCDATTGSYELRFGGTSVLSATDVNTKAGAHDYHSSFYLLRWSLDAPYFDDLYFLDGSGSQNNDFLGNCRVEAIFPSADSGTTQWTPSAGSDHYALVSEAACDDSTFVEDSTPDDKDLFDYASLQNVTGGIKGVQVNTQARITDATAFNLKTPCHSGSTDSDDSGQTLGASFANYRRIIELDPDTAAAWTVGGVNSAQFGVKVG